MKYRYDITLSWSKDVECWNANVPVLGSCSAHGATPAEALEKVETAIELWTIAYGTHNMARIARGELG